MPKKLSEKDFKYYKDLAIKDISAHDDLLNSVNRPDDVIAGFNGLFPSSSGKHDVDSRMIENYLFIGANTILPSLFFQLPKIQLRAKREDLDFEAAVLSGLINSEFGEDEKLEIQLCIIDAFLPYGFAVMKNGYNSRTGKTKNKASVLTGKTEGGQDKDNDMEGEVEYLKFEKAITVRQSPKFTYLDSTQPFGKGNRITFVYKRTLQQLMDSNLYNLSSNFISYFGARAEDKRCVDITLNEQWIKEGAYVYKFVWVEGWQEELAWIETIYDEIPSSFLRFNKMGDILYAVSHGTLGIHAQKELNYLNELWKKHIDNIRNQIAAQRDALTKSGQMTLENNEIGGVVWFDKPITQGNILPISSNPMDPNLFNNIVNVREYLKLILSTSGAIGGGPDSDLATVERNKEIGNVLRSSGMQDDIRVFLKDIIKQRIKNILKLGSIERIIKLTGQNLFSPTGKRLDDGAELELGGENGLSLKDIITGNIDTDFIFDIDIVSAAKPDFPIVRKQLVEGAKTVQLIKNELAMAGKQFDWAKWTEMYFDTFDTVPNAKALIKDIPPELAITPEMLATQSAADTSGGAPTSEQIAQGAEKVPTGIEGLTQ